MTNSAIDLGATGPAAQVRPRVTETYPEAYAEGAEDARNAIAAWLDRKDGRPIKQIIAAVAQALKHRTHGANA